MWPKLIQYAKWASTNPYSFKSRINNGYDIIAMPWKKVEASNSCAKRVITSSFDGTQPHLLAKRRKTDNFVAYCWREFAFIYSQKKSNKLVEKRQAFSGCQWFGWKLKFENQRSRNHNSVLAVCISHLSRELVVVDCLLPSNPFPGFTECRSTL